MLVPVLVGKPSGTAVSLEEAKVHLRVSWNDEDDYIGSLIEAAECRLDGYAGTFGRAILSQQWEEYFAGFPAEIIRLRVGPVTGVVSIKYWDGGGQQQVLDPGAYGAPLTDALGSFVQLRSGARPAVSPRPDAVAVRYVAGALAPADVPKAIKHGILMVVGHWYERRETVVIGDTAQELPFAASTIEWANRRNIF